MELFGYPIVEIAAAIITYGAIGLVGLVVLAYLVSSGAKR